MCEFVFDPKHYLALLEQKPGALDQAAPLQNWTLSRTAPAFTAAFGSIQVLRLIEAFPEALVAAAAAGAIHLGTISFDAVKQLVLTKLECRTANLDLAAYPYLPAANMKMTAAADYTGAPAEQTVPLF